jgi:hypothetical protein
MPIKRIDSEGSSSLSSKAFRLLLLAKDEAKRKMAKILELIISSPPHVISISRVMVDG